MKFVFNQPSGFRGEDVEYRSNFSEVDVAPAKNDKVNKVTKINCRIKSKPHAHLQTMDKKLCKAE